MNDNDALKRLRLLMKEDGALKIPLPFHACSAELVLDRDMAADPDGAKAKACVAYAEKEGHVPGMAGGYRSLGHYRLVEIKRIEEAEGSKSGRFRAYADDDLGSTITGTPSALLARLTEHERE